MKSGKQRSMIGTVSIAAALIFGAGVATAQTMGEYGTTLGDAASVAQGSGSTMQPPSVHPNPVGESSATTSIEVSNSTREDDSYNDSRDDNSHDTHSGDDWTPANN